MSNLMTVANDKISGAVKFKKVSAKKLSLKNKRQFSYLDDLVNFLGQSEKPGRLREELLIKQRQNKRAENDKALLGRLGTLCAKAGEVSHNSFARDNALKILNNKKKLEAKSHCGLVGLAVENKNILSWTTMDWVKMLILSKNYLVVMSTYYEKAIDDMAVNSFYDNRCLQLYGSTENLVNGMIDLLDYKTMFNNMYVVITKYLAKLTTLERDIVDYLVYKKPNLNKILKKISRRKIYRVGSDILPKLVSYFEEDGKNAGWFYDNFKNFAGLVK